MFYVIGLRLIKMMKETNKKNKKKKEYVKNSMCQWFTIRLNKPPIINSMIFVKKFERLNFSK